MTASHRLIDYLNHMLEAARQACLYVETMNKADFLSDRRTQQAVILNLLILGEAVTKTRRSSGHDCYPAGEIERGVHVEDWVWDTAQTALPDLLAQLPAIRDAVMADNPNSSGQ